MPKLSQSILIASVFLLGTACNRLGSKSGASSDTDQNEPGTDMDASPSPEPWSTPSDDDHDQTPITVQPTPVVEPSPPITPIELPPFPTPPNLAGIKLDQIERLAATKSFEVATLSEQVVQAAEERLRIEDQLIWEIEEEFQEAWDEYQEKKREYYDAKEAGEDPLPPFPYAPVRRSLNPAETEEIHAADHLADAARSAYSGGVADQINAAQDAYLALLTERSKIRSLEAMRSFLERLMDQIKKLVDAGELPESRLRLLKASHFDNDAELALAHKRHLELGNALARAVGEMPDRDPSIFADMELPNIGAVPAPNLKPVEDLAVSRSFAIQQLFDLREASLARYKAAEWLYAISCSCQPDEQRQHEMAIEDAKAAELTVQMIQTEGQVRENIIAIEAGMQTAIIRFQTFQQSLTELEAVFQAELMELRDGELELIQVISLVDRIFETRHDLEVSSLEFVGLQNDLDRALLGGAYGVLPIYWEPR